MTRQPAGGIDSVAGVPPACGAALWAAKARRLRGQDALDTRGQDVRDTPYDFLNGLLAALMMAGVLSGVVGFAHADEATGEKPIWLVVTRPMFTQALSPLVEHRKADGFETVLSTKPVEEAIQNCPRPPAYILLVGDDEPGRQAQPWYLPAVNVRQSRWNVLQKPTYASDAAYGDRNKDRFPEIPVGRLPVRTAEQVHVAVRKILAYESRLPRLEDLELLVWAGSTFWGDAFDRMAAQTISQMMKHAMPGRLEPFVVSANRGAMYCQLPEQPDVVHQRLARNPGLIFLIGHGQPDKFFLGTWRFTPTKSSSVGCGAEFFLARRSNTEPLSPMVILACYCGQFVGGKPSLAEELVLSPVGPVACIAASAESHPLPNLYTGQAVLRTARQPNRLGDFWRQTLRVAKTIRNPMMEALLKYVESTLGHSVDLEAIRQDQATLYQIFGDPATQLRLPHALDCTIQANGDGTWRWSVQKPHDADRLMVTFRPVDQTLSPPPKDWDDAAAVRQAFQRANQRMSFQTLAELPHNQPWKGEIRQPGVLRLVALGPKRIYAVSKKLTPKADKSRSK